MKGREINHTRLLCRSLPAQYCIIPLFLELRQPLKMRDTGSSLCHTNYAQIQHCSQSQQIHSLVTCLCILHVCSWKMKNNRTSDRTCKQRCARAHTDTVHKDTHIHLHFSLSVQKISKWGRRYRRVISREDIGVDQGAIFFFYISGFIKFKLLCSFSAITLTWIFSDLFLSAYLSFSYCISPGPVSSSVQLKSTLLADPSLVCRHSSKAVFVTAYIVCMWCKLCVSLSNLVS